MWLDTPTFDGVDAKVGLPTVARSRMQASGGWWAQIFTRSNPLTSWLGRVDGFFQFTAA